MAKQLTYNSTDNVTEVFRPQTNFIVFIANGGANLGSNETYIVQFVPDQEADNSNEWQDAPGAIPLQTTVRVDEVNGSPGFKYRIRRTGSSGPGANVEFYWDHITTLRAVYS